ncbi:hypothetical protein GCM10010411_76380 [Actinomadura fulvescens]|uniref:Uncharacterized protein n=1 Tax=Actinomadura fulvescens TaxID=46160 RepID=A0ABN3QJQ7_9ACTN
MNTSAAQAVIEGLYIGSRVIYRGSLVELRGYSFILLPCGFGNRCPKCEDGRSMFDADEAPHLRYSLYAPDGTVACHVRATSLALADSGWWPTGALALGIGGYRFLACHTAPGGSPYARAVHFHTADGLGGDTWCRFDAVDETVRRLDAAGRRCLALGA